MDHVDAEKNLLFGLIALQIGLIDQSKLVVAFRAWTLDKSRGLAGHLVGKGELDAAGRAAVKAVVERHLKKHGRDAERSLAAIPETPPEAGEAANFPREKRRELAGRSAKSAEIKETTPDR
ncbi:MAG: hypothetical protein ACLQIB_07995 [Isosphaeraceae bacterium]